MAAHQAPLFLGFSNQEHWSGLPFPSPLSSEKWKWSHSVMSDLQRPHGLQPTRLLHPWDFPGKSTGVVCHGLLREYASRRIFMQIWRWVVLQWFECSLLLNFFLFLKQLLFFLWADSTLYSLKTLTLETAFQCQSRSGSCKLFAFECFTSPPLFVRLFFEVE